MFGKRCYNTVILGRRTEAEANPESITTGVGFWVPARARGAQPPLAWKGSRFSCRRDYELLSMWARSSATDPNLIVPWGNLASIDPSA